MFRQRRTRSQSASATMESARDLRAAAQIQQHPHQHHRLNRSHSLPTHEQLKGILKHKTVDDSLHQPYRKRDAAASPGGAEETDSSTGSRSPKSIEFKEISIREYARTIGDNPSCSSGPPIGIGWAYNKTIVIPVDQYEELRPPRRTHFEMILPREVRQRMLRREWDVTQQQMASAVRNNIRIKNQRRATINNLGKATKLEEMMESAGKALVRSLFLKKSTRKQLQELEEQMEKARKARAAHQMERMEVAMEDLVATEGKGYLDEEDRSEHVVESLKPVVEAVEPDESGETSGAAAESEASKLASAALKQGTQPPPPSLESTTTTTSATVQEGDEKTEDPLEEYASHEFLDAQQWAAGQEPKVMTQVTLLCPRVPY